MLIRRCCFASVVFFFNDTATTEIYTLSLHDALPISFSISGSRRTYSQNAVATAAATVVRLPRGTHDCGRSEEHTSELQSLAYLVCRLLLEKKKNKLRASAGARDLAARPSTKARVTVD